MGKIKNIEVYSVLANLSIEVQLHRNTFGHVDKVVIPEIVLETVIDDGSKHVSLEALIHNLQGILDDEKKLDRQS